MNEANFLHKEEMRGEVYKLLSRLYYVPDDAIFEQVAKLKEALNSVYPEIAKLVTVDATIDIEQLTVEFSKLFVGPFKLLAPPYGSVYLESGRRVMGDSTMNAKNRYREAGLAFSDNIKEAADHIALELEFMYFLVFKEMEAFENADNDSVLAFRERQIKFLVDHLGVWVSMFAQKVESHATFDFYKAIAEITKLFVLNDKDEMVKASLTNSVV